MEAVKKLKKTIVGIGLLLYALFLTPCMLEPSDLVVSTGWMAAAAAFFGSSLASVIIPLWMASGYIAFIVGALLVGHSFLKRFGVAGGVLVAHPVVVIIIVTILAVTATVYFM